MKLANPYMLLALSALPALIVLYVVHARRERNRAAVFTSPLLAASVTPWRPGIRRHLPFVAFLLALTVMTVALARPQRTVAVPVERAQIMLVTDVSGSMQSTDVAPTRLRAAQEAARRFLNGVPKNVNVGVMVFNQIPRVLQSPTTDRDALRAAIAQYRASGGTATGDAINAAVRALRRAPLLDGQRPPSAIVLLSDGVSVHGADPVQAAAAAREQKIPISTVALGTASGTITVPRPRGQSGTITRPVPPDPATLRQIAERSGGKAFNAGSTSDLSSVYQQLGSQLGRKQEKRDLTAGLAGVAGLLMLIGSALSLRWFGRIA